MTCDQIIRLLEKIDKRLESADRSLTAARDDLLLVQEGLLTSGFLPTVIAAGAGNPQRPSSLPADMAVAISQAAAGVRSVAIRWEKSIARVKIDAFAEQRFPRKLALVLEALCANVVAGSDGLVGYKDVDYIVGHLRLYADDSPGKHAVVNLISRLKHELPNPYFIQRETEPLRYRFTLSREGLLIVKRPVSKSGTDLLRERRS